LDKQEGKRITIKQLIIKKKRGDGKGRREGKNLRK